MEHASLDRFDNATDLLLDLYQFSQPGIAAGTAFSVQPVGLLRMSGWKDRDAVHETQWLQTHEYQRAFLSISASETAALMGEYLTDEHFGELAARVLLVQWTKANEPEHDKKFNSGVDFSRV